MKFKLRLQNINIHLLEITFFFDLNYILKPIKNIKISISNINNIWMGRILKDIAKEKK